MQAFALVAIMAPVAVATIIVPVAVVPVPIPITITAPFAPGMLPPGMITITPRMLMYVGRGQRPPLDDVTCVVGVDWWW